MPSYLEDFIRHYTGKGSSDRSARGVSWALIQAERYFAPKDLHALTRRDLAQYHRYLTHIHKSPLGEPLANNTIITRLASLRAFYRYLVDAKVLLTNPASSLKLPQAQTRKPEDIPSHAAIRRILDTTPAYTPVEIRDRVMIETLYACGLRAQELLGLDVKDVDLKKSVLWVRHGKFKKDRVVPMGGRAQEALKSYLSNTREFFRYADESTALFPGLRSKRVTYSGLSKAVYGRFKKTGINTHKLRHAASLGMLKNGASIEAVRDFLGHKNIQTTTAYLQLTPQDLRQAQKDYHPRP